MSSRIARRYVLTASFAAITATGAWYGAGLKTRQEASEEQKAAAVATTADKIAALESQRARLMTHRGELERKIERLTAKSEQDVKTASG